MSVSQPGKAILYSFRNKFIDGDGCWQKNIVFLSNLSFSCKCFGCVRYTFFTTTNNKDNNIDDNNNS